MASRNRENIKIEPVIYVLFIFALDGDCRTIKRKPWYSLKYIFGCHLGWMEGGWFGVFTAGFQRCSWDESWLMLWLYWLMMLQFCRRARRKTTSAAHRHPHKPLVSLPLQRRARCLYVVVVINVIWNWDGRYHYSTIAAHEGGLYHRIFSVILPALDSC